MESPTFTHSVDIGAMKRSHTIFAFILIFLVYFATSKPTPNYEQETLINISNIQELEDYFMEDIVKIAIRQELMQILRDTFNEPKSSVDPTFFRLYNF